MRSLLIVLVSRVTARLATEPKIHARHDRYFGVLARYLVDVPASCGLVELGSGDDTKRTCLDLIPSTDPSSPRYAEGADCVVISVGSRNSYIYEEAVIRETACRVHTFDCTITPQVPEFLEQSRRFYFHRVCLGEEDRGLYVRYETMAAMVNGTEPGVIAALKMDIEGWEYAALENMGDAPPPQISVELHGVTHARYEAPGFVPAHDRAVVPHFQDIFLPELFENLKNLKLADRNDNPFCAHCSEVLFLRSDVYGGPATTTTTTRGPSSLMEKYGRLTSKRCDGRPCPNLLRKIVQARPSRHPFKSVYARDDVILVCVASFDVQFLDSVVALVESNPKIQRVRVLGDGDKVVGRLISKLGGTVVAYHLSSSFDDDLVHVHAARHLAVQTGFPEAALYASLASNSLYVNPDLKATLSPSFLDVSPITI
ncbi:hypothetical protein CTAYLR_005167 [Chrysophaeum taylorii]|uniref:Methyltransferase domain-containing protein n=1 Tax=Chrysophaeum taylorii TaxID=2483200 RepID=A0AAD7ULZ6_9STRA|nr:hypothetical protein CTAYLR_005167 [Chrysophaeum taylorii]